MNTQDSEQVTRAAKRIYDERLRSSLETSHMNTFVAIEPVSGDYFLGQTLSEAIGASRTKYPDRLAHAIGVGHKAAMHFGVLHETWHVNSGASRSVTVWRCRR